jgi:hypothetical protein
VPFYTTQGSHRRSRLAAAIPQMPRPVKDEKRMVERRRRNALYAKRKYYKKKTEVERLEGLKVELSIENVRLQDDRTRLESMLVEAQRMVQSIESAENQSRGSQALRHPRPRKGRSRPRKSLHLPVSPLDTNAGASSASARNELAASVAALPAAAASDRTTFVASQNLLAGIAPADVDASLHNYLLHQYCSGVQPDSATSPPLLASMIRGNLQSIDTLRHILCLPQDSTNPYGFSLAPVGYTPAPVQLPWTAPPS